MTKKNDHLAEAKAERLKTKGVLCAKCNHLNPPGSTRCDRCESHLHIKCNDCGARNERIYTRCTECGRRLHKNLFERMNAKTFRRGAKVTVGQIVVAILAAVGVFAIIMFLLHVRLPRP